jgi:ubiquinone/menaquinone biosynthesis C-methylase UbiE
MASDDVGVTQRSESVVFDRVAHDYDATRGGDKRGEAVAVAAAPLLPADPILEIGVGTGLVAGALTRAGRQVIGVDLSVPMLQYAAGRIPGRIAVADAQRLPLADGAVSSVLFVHVLHLVQDTTATLAEAGRVLAPGGRIVASVSQDTYEAPEDVEQVLIAMAQRVGRQLDGRQDQTTQVLAAAARAGLRQVDETSYTAWYRQGTPTRTIERIQTRSWSWMWELPDEIYDPAAADAIAALRALPDQDRPRAEERPVTMLALAVFPA